MPGKGGQRQPVGGCGGRKSMDFHGFQWLYDSMVFYGFPWVFHGLPWFTIVFNGFPYRFHIAHVLMKKNPDGGGG